MGRGHMAKISIDSGAEGFECSDGDTILRAALRAGHGMPYSCNVGSCGNCKFTLVEGEVDHLRPDAPAWSERDLKRSKWLGCQARPKGDCTIKFRADPDSIPPHRPVQRRARLARIQSITHDIHEFRFETDGPDDFRPGQYALLDVPGVEGARAYSMCNLPGEGHWSFQIKRVPGGAATEALFALEPGAEIGLDGPYSNAYLREDVPRDIVLMAGGSGLSPMASIARGIEAAGLLDDRKVHFFYGCRSKQDLIALAELPTPLSDQIIFYAALSENAEAGHRQGFLHDVVASEFGEALKDHEIYFAGPAVMAAAIQKTAYDLGVPMSQLHFDEFY